MQLRPPQMLQGQPVSQAQQQAAQQRSNAQVAQLQSILAQNQMPDGRALTDDIRNSIIARLTQAQRAPQRGDSPRSHHSVESSMHDCRGAVLLQVSVHVWKKAEGCQDCLSAAFCLISMLGPALLALRLTRVCATQACSRGYR